VSYSTSYNSDHRLILISRSQIVPTPGQLSRFHLSKSGSRGGAKTEDHSEYGMSAIDESSVGDQEPVTGNMAFTIPQTGYEEQVWGNTGLEAATANNISGGGPTSFDVPTINPFDTNLDPSFFFDNSITLPGNNALVEASSSQYLPPPSLPSSFTAGFGGLGLEGQFAQEEDLTEMSNVMPTYSPLFDLATTDFFDDMPNTPDYTHTRYEA